MNRRTARPSCRGTGSSASRCEGGYSICYVNAFQSQDDEDGVDRPDERSNWPAELLLSGAG